MAHNAVFELHSLLCAQVQRRHSPLPRCAVRLLAHHRATYRAHPFVTERLRRLHVADRPVADPRARSAFDTRLSLATRPPRTSKFASTPQCYNNKCASPTAAARRLSPFPL
eukprot:IDg14447t1